MIRLFTPLRICFNSFTMLSSTKMGKTQPIRIVIRLINNTPKKRKKIREKRKERGRGVKEKGGNDNLDN